MYLFRTRVPELRLCFYGPGYSLQTVARLHLLITSSPRSYHDSCALFLSSRIFPLVHLFSRLGEMVPLPPPASEHFLRPVKRHLWLTDVSLRHFSSCELSHPRLVSLPPSLPRDPVPLGFFLGCCVPWTSLRWFAAALSKASLITLEKGLEWKIPSGWPVL